MTDTKDFQKAVGLINNSTNVLLTAHTRPDGDACGSVRAMCEILAHLGKKANPIFLSPLPQWYTFLFDQPVPILGNDIAKEQLHDGHYDDCDLVIIVDTDSYVQLPAFDEWLKETHIKVLVIDHHITGDGLGDIQLIDTRAAAAGEIVLDLIKFAKWPITEKIAETLFVAIATDTGWFKFNNATSHLFNTAAELVEAGARPASIWQKLYHNFTHERMMLMVRMLSTLDFHLNGRVAIQYIMRKDFDETGATGKDTENLIDECKRICDVEVAVLLVELSDGGFRCSIRSKGKVDVRQVAQRYGGGGHTLASGVNLPGPLKKAKQLVIDALVPQLINHHSQ